MTTFYNQPLAHRFGTELIKEFSNPAWTTFESAVAWARRSGTAHIMPGLRSFIRGGGLVRISVGIDIQNTSQEGLEDLLTLTTEGSCEVFVYHDEASTTFHPKVYLFRNDNAAKLIVGSNNLTESGLFVNTEAGLEILGKPTDLVIQEALDSLAAWRDPADRLALPLDQYFLQDLISQGYVLPEASLKPIKRKPKLKGGAARPIRKLFGRSKVTRPPKPASVSRKQLPRQPQAPVIVGQVLLMRVRRASATSRRTQTQVPKPVFESPFFGNITSIISAHDGRRHNISTASARGGINTFKLEVPEIGPYTDPVIRFERTKRGIIYQTYDANSLLGRPIMTALRRGLTTKPASTYLTKPQTPETSTWWRFI